MEPDAELWRDIPDYEGLYQASNQGRIRSIDRVIKQASPHGGIIERRMPGRVLAPWAHSADGRPWVSLPHGHPAGQEVVEVVVIGDPYGCGIFSTSGGLLPGGARALPDGSTIHWGDDYQPDW